MHLTELHGYSFIGGKTARADDTPVFHAVNPATGETLEPGYHEAADAEVSEACEAAKAAFRLFRLSSPVDRARLLRRIAEAIESLGSPLLERFTAETGLPHVRAAGECARTVGQLRLFANALEDGTWAIGVEDAADPARQPLPKQETKLFTPASDPWRCLVPPISPWPLTRPEETPRLPWRRAVR